MRTKEKRFSSEFSYGVIEKLYYREIVIRVFRFFQKIGSFEKIDAKITICSWARF